MKNTKIQFKQNYDEEEERIKLYSRLKGRKFSESRSEITKVLQIKMSNLNYL